MEEKKFLKNMWGTLKKFYEYLLTFPERLYPFTEEVEGKKVTGERAYKIVYSRNERLYGDAYSLQSPKLLLWREAFNFGGSIFLVIIAHLMFIHLSFLNGFVFLVLVVLCVAVQEFYLQPNYYKQKTQKGIIDFVVWMFPIFLYIAL